MFDAKCMRTCTGMRVCMGVHAVRACMPCVLAVRVCVHACVRAYMRACVRAS